MEGLILACIFFLISAGSNPDFLNRGITIAVFWDNGRQPLWIETLQSRVRWGSRTSRHSLTRNVGAGSRSELLAAEALMILDISSGREMSNESRLQSVRVKTGGGADAVAYRMVSTFDSRNDRNSAGLKGGDVDLPADLPKTVETVRHSFLKTNFSSLTVRSQNSFSFVLKRWCFSRRAVIQANRYDTSLEER